MRISDWSSDVCSSDLGTVGDHAADLLADAPLLALLGEVFHQQRDRQAALHLELRVEAFLRLVEDLVREVGGDDLDPPARQAGRLLLEDHGEGIGLLPARAGRAPDADLLACGAGLQQVRRSEEHTSELQSLMRISYAVFCLKKK